ncbi:hypothetical protein HF521_011788, partial [Silurus meridionalis]
MGEHCPHSYVGGVNFNNELLGWVRKDEDGCLFESPLNSKKCLLSLGAPKERAEGRRQKVEGRRHRTIALYEAAIKIGEAQEPLKLEAGGGGWPVPDCLDPGRVHQDI